MPEEINELQDLPEEDEEQAPGVAVANSTVSWGC
jgi:hypothetical protein